MVRRVWRGKRKGHANREKSEEFRVVEKRIVPTLKDRAVEQ
jgi:hypothetical protein